MSIFYKNTKILINIGICLTILGCASIVHTPTSIEGMPDEKLALLATAGSAEKNVGAGMISNVDGKSFSNGWKYKLPAGMHTFTLTPRGANISIQHRINLEAGKRYDIESDGTVWVRNRAGLDDSKFIGSNLSMKPFELMFADAGGGYLSGVQQADKNLLELKKQQQAIKDRELQAETKAAQRKIFLSKKIELGSKVCQAFNGSLTKDGGYVRGILSSSPFYHLILNYSGVMKVTAFVEQDTGNKLQIRISGISFSGDSYDGGERDHYSGQLERTSYKDSTLVTGSLAWDEKSNWAYCD